MSERKLEDGRKCRAWGGETVTERHVQAIWYDRELRPATLTTIGGEAVTVVHPGEWNLEAGPDFKGAVLEIGVRHRRVAGDIEVHVNPMDWEAHGHGGDGKYKNVVAHVTWLRGRTPPTLPPGAVTICIGGAAMSDPLFSLECIDASAYPFARLPSEERPCFRTVGSNPRVANDMLAAAGETRLLAKARRLADLLAARPGERDQVFYEEMMAVFGYKRNEQAFRRVAAAVPLAQIRAEPGTAAAAMSAAAGFVEWNKGSSRPLNSPQARLDAAAAFFSSPGSMFLSCVASFTPNALRSMMAFISKPGVMGRGRAAAAIANVVVPFALAEGRTDCIPMWLPPEEISAPVRIVASRMFGRDHYPPAHYSGNGLLIQGLIQIHRDFCLHFHPECEKCALSEDYAGMRFVAAL